MNQPLGKAPTPPSRVAGLGLAAARASAVVAAVVVAWGVFTLWRAVNRGEEPLAVARIETAPEPVAPVAPASAPAAQADAGADSGLGASPTSDDIEASSGVKVVRNGGGGPSQGQIIDVQQALAVSLTPAPDKRLVEKSRFGLLPRIGADGARPAEVYARPVIVSSKLKGAPRIAILVGGLGLDSTGTKSAISRLPAAISLGFAPYGGDLEQDAALARQAGHEILLQAPMEPFGAPANPSPHMLTSSASEAENRESLQWMMGRFTGYVGVANYLGGKFTTDSHAFAPVLAEIASRGLAYLDDGSSPRSLTSDLAPGVNLRATSADVVIDATPTPEAIEASLIKLEILARRQDGAIGIATALPSSVEHLARWAAALESRGIELVPISSLVARAPPKSAGATP